MQGADYLVRGDNTQLEYILAALTKRAAGSTLDQQTRYHWLVCTPLTGYGP
jgi:hypothetical protein